MGVARRGRHACGVVAREKTRQARRGAKRNPDSLNQRIIADLQLRGRAVIPLEGGTKDHRKAVASAHQAARFIERRVRTRKAGMFLHVSLVEEVDGDGKS